MFKPVEDRLDYGKILSPPAGFKCDFAIGTTYSLDLEALLGVPLALFLSEEMDGALSDNPIYILEGLRKSADNFALFCEGGQIKVPSNANAVFALLENSVFQIALKNEKSFHPKVWLIKYVNNAGKSLYRYIILSRNLTFDRSWDVVAVLEGEANRKKTLKNQPLIDFLAYLQRSITDGKKKKRIDKIAGELEYVHFKTGDQYFTDFSFIPIGIGEDYNFSPTAAIDKFKTLLVISPFLSRDTVIELDKLSLKNSNKTLITRRSEIPKLTNDLLNSIEVYCLKETIIDGEEAISESEAALSELQKQDIHAKVYFKYKYPEHSLYIGSANCSTSAWNGNVEFMLQLKYEKRGFNISQVVDELFCRNGKEIDERLNPFERILSIPDATIVEDDVQQRLQKAIKRICCSRTKASVSESGSRFSITIDFDMRYVVPDIDFKIAALGGGKAAKIESLTIIPGLDLLALSEFYIITATLGEESLQRIIKIRTEGIPGDRDKAIFKSVIRDKNTFLRYIAFLLCDDYLLAALDQMELNKAASSKWNLHSYDMPVLYENMLRAIAESPQKLQEIEYVINRVNDSEIIPPEFIKLYSKFLLASRRIKS